MKFNGFSTFLYMLAELHLVMHVVLRLRKAPIRKESMELVSTTIP
jgi:hypothetical protein